ncbi:MAG: hypothetical protein HZB31_12385 [Nitrospirae bacterium]|nr:hypothetical protein [Nitrospirota bacterium]
MRRSKKGGMFSWAYRPLCFAVVLIALFGLVWLRSSVTTAAYSIRDLEDKRTTALKELKTLMAERSKLMAISSIDLPNQVQTQGEKKLVSGNYVFPDRVKVIHVTRTKGPEAYKASYQEEKKN